LANCFSKYHGRGNDFILISDLENQFVIDKKKIAFLCHRNFGIGADGLILLQKSSLADIKMRIFNCDGIEAKGCGNGLLCLLSFINDNKILQKRDISIETGDRIVYAQTDSDLYSINMGKPKDLLLHQSLSFGQKTYPYHFVNTGVEHVVLYVRDVEKAPVERLGKKIRYHPLFAPGGANINFVQKKRETFFVRTYEKGVEQETFSCGTGALAVGLIPSLLYGGKKQKICFQQGNLQVLYKEDFLFLVGNATFVYQGSF
jgi:diaminopimelate epimerase